MTGSHSVRESLSPMTPANTLAWGYGYQSGSFLIWRHYLPSKYCFYHTNLKLDCTSCDQSLKAPRKYGYGSMQTSIKSSPQTVARIRPYDRPETTKQRAILPRLLSTRLMGRRQRRSQDTRGTVSRASERSRTW